jgi:hypothetical protein
MLIEPPDIANSNVNGFIFQPTSAILRVARLAGWIAITALIRTS